MGCALEKTKETKEGRSLPRPSPSSLCYLSPCHRGTRGSQIRPRGSGRALGKQSKTEGLRGSGCQSAPATPGLCLLPFPLLCCESLLSGGRQGLDTTEPTLQAFSDLCYYCKTQMPADAGQSSPAKRGLYEHRSLFFPFPLLHQCTWAVSPLTSVHVGICIGICDGCRLPGLKMQACNKCSFISLHLNVMSHGPVPWGGNLNQPRRSVSHFRLLPARMCLP